MSDPAIHASIELGWMTSPYGATGSNAGNGFQLATNWPGLVKRPGRNGYGKGPPASYSRDLIGSLGAGSKPIKSVVNFA